MTADYKEIIEYMIVKSNSDKCGGMSLLSEFIDYYTSLDSNNKYDMINVFINIINIYDNNKLIIISWLLAGLSSNDIYIPGALEMLEARIMRESYHEKPSADFIFSIEEDIRIIKRNITVGSDRPY